MRDDHAPGPMLREFPRTMSFGNWPFLVFLLVLAGAVSIPMAMNGNWLAVAAMVGAVFIVPVFIAILQPVAELFGRRAVQAIHDNGIVWRRAWLRGFIPWSQVAAITRVETATEGATVTSWHVQERVRGADPIVLDNAVGGAEGAALIASKLRP